MKKTYSLFTAAFTVLLVSASDAQCSLGFIASSPMALHSKSPINGAGIGFEFMSGPIKLIKARTGTRKSELELPPPLAIHFGGHLYFNGAGHEKFKNIPLLNPGTGNATAEFQNVLYNANFSMRITSSLANGYIIPYVEGFTGLRYFSSDLTITPDDVSQKTSRQGLGEISGLATGGSAGMMFRMGNNDCFLDFGATWSHSDVTGEYVDIHSLKKVGNSIGYKSLALPNDFLMFKIGFVGYVSGWGDGGGSSSSGHHYHGGGFHCGGHSGGHASIGLIKF
ncbi:MAG: hypothetical protein ACJ77K_10155 [Bacteroidia bacterium]